MPEDVASDRRGTPNGLPRLTRFEVVRRVGEGGAGLVYEAIDRDRKARVALKMLRVLDGEMLLRLKEEFRSLQDIEHPNLIRLFELSCDEGTWFFTMELLEGEHFNDYVCGEASPLSRSQLRDPGGVPAKDARQETTGVRPVRPERAPRAVDYPKLRDAFVQLARGLVALHQAGKVHRDIKPSNVLVQRDGRVVILDLGLVHDSRDALPMDADLVVGTISHMAPEQAAGDDVGPAADWYSVGTVLYQCLTGRHPFEGAASDVLERKQVEDPPRPRDVVPGVPDDLDALCMALLAREPAARPKGAEVLRLLESLPASERPPARASGQTPFVGRTEETRALREALARARGLGRATVTIVEGESGVGKSALVRRFTRALQEEEDVLVLSGRCYEREDVPYKAIDGVIDALSHYLSTLTAAEGQRVLPPTAFVLAYAFPVLRRVSGMELGPAFRLGGLQESRSLLFHALRELFANLAAQRPFVIVIDDLQWADADSLAALAEILRPPSPPLLLIATARAPSEPREKDAAPFGLPGDVNVLPVPRLTAREGLELVTMLAGEISPSVAQRIAEEAQGHPLFVDELVRHAELHGGAAPANLHLDDALFARVSRIDDGARGVLELLAVAGVALEQDLVMRASGAAFSDFSSHVQTLRTAHLARTDGWRGEDTIETYHDRVREAVATRLSADARKRCHARLAGALEAAETKDADALSLHWLGAGDDAKAGAYARVAAEQALAALAFESAARLFERALKLAALGDKERQELRLKLAETLANAGRGREAAQWFFDAAAVAAPDRALDLRRRGAEELLTTGRLDEGDAVLHSVLDAVGIGLPRTPLVALLGLLFFRFVLFVRGLGYKERAEAELDPHALTRLDAYNGVGRILALIDTIRGSYFQTRGLLEALRLGEPKRLAHALVVEAVYLATSPGNEARSGKLLSQAAAIAERTENVQMGALVEVLRGFSALVLGRLPQALAHTDRGALSLKENFPGAFWDRRTAQLCGIWTVGWMGDLNGLAERVEQGVRDAEHRNDIYTGTTLRTGVPNLIWLRKGDPAAARAVVLEAMRQWTQRGYHSQHYWSLLALTRVDLYEGDARGAYARVARDWPRLTRSLILQVRLMALEALHMRANAALAVAAEENGSERERMLRAAEGDARRIDAMRWEISVPFARILDAGVAALRRDDARAVRELEAAAKGFDEQSLGLHRAVACWHLGRLRGGDDGRASVASAESWLTQQGVAAPARMAGAILGGFRR